MSSRRYRDISLALADDLGGADKLSESTRILIRQAAALSVAVENLQAKIISGAEADVNNTEQLVRLSNVQARALQRLGLKKPEPPRPPSLMELLAQASPRRSGSANPAPGSPAPGNPTHNRRGKAMSSRGVSASALTVLTKRRATASWLG
jgi:hypothetical protein